MSHTVSTPFEQAVFDLLKSRWNTTTNDATFSKIIIALHRRNFYSSVCADAERLREQGSFNYISDFFSKVERLQSIVPVDEHSQQVYAQVIEHLQPHHSTLVRNATLLMQSDLVELLTHFSNDFRGTIEKIYVLDTFQFIATSKASKSYFYAAVSGQLLTECWDNLDQALVGAIAYKHQGPNSQAAKYFNRMIGI